MTRATLFALAALTFACGPKPAPPPPVPGPLKAGVATLPLDAPVGLPMGGYGRKKVAGEQGSPFAEKLPASTGIQTLPTARAIALSDGLTTTVFVRLDVCLTTNNVRFEAQRVLTEKGYDAQLILVSTHTHAGPARYFRPAPAEGSGGIDPTAIAMDVFDPETEERFGASVAAAAMKAVDGMVPASMGFSSIEAGQFNHDRRCENDDLYGAGFRDKTLSVVRIDAVDDSGAPTHPLTGFINYAMHGTVLGGDNDLYSVEAPGSMELWASDAVGGPLMYLQGSAGDVSPDTGGGGFDDFQAIEKLGRTAAPLIAGAFQQATPPKAPAHAKLVRFERPVDLLTPAMGYASGEFPAYGGIACGLGAENCPPVPSTPAELICLPLKKRPFSQTTVVALQLENVVFGTLPGEPTTKIGERARALFDGVEGADHRLVVGYAQDHYGYILEEPDYLRLGYEPTVSPWGYRFGDFILGQLGEAAKALGQTEPAHSMPDRSATTRRTPSTSTVAPAAEGAVADAARLATVTFRFHGGDPALGTPIVSLEREEGSGFVAGMASATRPLSMGPDIVVRWASSPSFVDDPTATSRDHLWTAEWETLPDTALGTWRFVARGQAKTASGTAPYEVRSNSFTLSKAQSAGAKAQAAVDASGKLTLVVQWPPNPTVKTAAGTITAGYRIRDLDSNPSDGAKVMGGTVQATVTDPDTTTESVTLTWNATAKAYVGQVKSGTGAWGVHVAANGVSDASGNSNGQAFDAQATR
jgi:hypothetical protein